MKEQAITSAQSRSSLVHTTQPMSSVPFQNFWKETMKLTWITKYDKINHLNADLCTEYDTIGRDRSPPQSKRASMSLHC